MEWTSEISGRIKSTGLFGLMNLFPESLLCVESLTNNDLVPSLGKVLYAKGHQAQKPDSDFTTLPIVNHIQAESKTMPWCKTNSCFMCGWNGATEVLFPSGLWPIPQTILSHRLRAKGKRGGGVEPGLNWFTILRPKFRISKI